MSGDTVVVVSPDASAAVLWPTLTDAIAASQLYAAQVAAAQIIVLAAQANVNNSAVIALNAANSALSAATTAAATAAMLVLPTINGGTATMATRSRLKRALNNAGNMQTVEDYVMNNFAQISDTSLEWKEGVFFPTTGVVYTMIKAALSYSDAQALALWVAAAALTG